MQPTSWAKTTSLEAADSFLSGTLSDVRIDYLSRAFRGKKKFWFWPFLLHTPALTGLTLDSRLQQTWAQINEEGLRVLFWESSESGYKIILRKVAKHETWWVSVESYFPPIPWNWIKYFLSKSRLLLPIATQNRSQDDITMMQTALSLKTPLPYWWGKFDYKVKIVLRI